MYGIAPYWTWISNISAQGPFEPSNGITLNTLEISRGHICTTDLTVMRSRLSCTSWDSDHGISTATSGGGSWDSSCQLIRSWCSTKTQWSNIRSKDSGMCTDHQQCFGYGPGTINGSTNGERRGSSIVGLCKDEGAAHWNLASFPRLANCCMARYAIRANGGGYSFLCSISAWGCGVPSFPGKNPCRSRPLTIERIRTCQPSLCSCNSGVGWFGFWHLPLLPSSFRESQRVPWLWGLSMVVTIGIELLWTPASIADGKTMAFLWSMWHDNLTYEKKHQRSTQGVFHSHKAFKRMQ